MIDINLVTEFIHQNGYVSTQDICLKFGISESTSRRLLDKLAVMGRVTRIHGGAMPASVNGVATEYQMRYALNRTEKIAIAKKAAEYVQDFSTIMLMGGTTVCEMCPYIEHMNITVVTSSMLVLNGLKHSRNVRILLLGGLYNPQEEDVGGLLANKGLENLHVDHLFASTSGFDETYGFSSTNVAVDLHMRCLEASVISSVLADSSKYMRGGAVITARMEQIQNLFTDSGLSERARNAIESRGVNVIIADPKE